MTEFSRQNSGDVNERRRVNNALKVNEGGVRDKPRSTEEVKGAVTAYFRCGTARIESGLNCKPPRILGLLCTDTWLLGKSAV
jgi:hypothetical protein